MFRGEHVETVAAGVFDTRTGRLALNPVYAGGEDTDPRLSDIRSILAPEEDGEVFIVARVKVLEPVLAGIKGHAVGDVVLVLERLRCDHCDAARSAQEGLYTNVGDLGWFKPSSGRIGGNDGYENTFGRELARMSVQYQFVLDDFCDVARGEPRWTLMPPQ